MRRRIDAARRDDEFLPLPLQAVQRLHHAGGELISLVENGSVHVHRDEPEFCGVECFRVCHGAMIYQSGKMVIMARVYTLPLTRHNKCT